MNRKGIVTWWFLVLISISIGFLYGKDVIFLDKNKQQDFENKIKCSSYLSEWEKRLNERRQHSISKQDYSIGRVEVFYNHMRNTCLLAYSEYGTRENKNDDSYYIVDFLKWERDIYYCNTYSLASKWSQSDCFVEWMGKVKDYKDM